MKLHSQAALTLKQRQRVRRLHLEEGVAVRKLAKEFRVNPSAIQRWVNRESPPLDHSSAPANHERVLAAARRERADRPPTGLRCTPEAWKALREYLGVATNDDVLDQSPKGVRSPMDEVSAGSHAGPYETHRSRARTRKALEADGLDRFPG